MKKVKLYLFIILMTIAIFDKIEAKIITITHAQISKMALRNFYDLLSRYAEIYTYTYAKTGQATYLKRVGLPEGGLKVYIDDFLVSDNFLLNNGTERYNFADIDLEYIDKIIINTNSVSATNGEVRIFTKGNFNAKELTAEILYRDAFFNHRDLSFIVNQQYSTTTSFSLFTDITDYQDIRESSDNFKLPYHRENIVLKSNFLLFNKYKNRLKLHYFRKKGVEVQNDTSFVEYKSFGFENKFSLIDKKNGKLDLLCSLNENYQDSTSTSDYTDSISNHQLQLGIMLLFKGIPNYSTNLSLLSKYQDFYSLKKESYLLEGNIIFQADSIYNLSSILLNNFAVNYSIGNKDLQTFGFSQNTIYTFNKYFSISSENRFFTGKEYSNYPTDSLYLANILIRESITLNEHNFRLNVNTKTILMNKSLIFKLSLGPDYLNISEIKGSETNQRVIATCSNNEQYYFQTESTIEYNNLFKFNISYYQKISNSDDKISIYNPDYSIITNLSYDDKFIEDELLLHLEINHRFSSYSTFDTENKTFIQKVNNLNFNASITILNFEFFYGSDNFLQDNFNLFDVTKLNMNPYYKYSTIDDYQMPTKDEIWGIRWIFRR